MSHFLATLYNSLKRTLCFHWYRCLCPHMPIHTQVPVIHNSTFTRWVGSWCHMTIMPHICISGSGQYWHFGNWTLRNKLQYNFNPNTKILIYKNAYENIVCETAAILSRERWVKSTCFFWLSIICMICVDQMMTFPVMDEIFRNLPW